MTGIRVAKPGEVRVLLLPVGSRSVVLPNPAVAEIIGLQSMATAETAPEWWLGRIDWRGRPIPVVSFEGFMGGHEPERTVLRNHIAVLNTLNGNRALPYIGLLFHGTARLFRANADNLASDPSGDLDSPLILEAVTVNNQPAWIPDLDALESMVLSVT